jgi:hypothetical protein
MHWPSRHAAHSLSAFIVRSSEDPADFLQIVGINDESSFSFPGTTWEMPAVYKDKCYVADTGSNIAADVAAQTAAALALVSHLLKKHGDASDLAAGGVPRMMTKALHAYAAARVGYEKGGDKAVCTLSGANRNCVGGCASSFMPVRTLRRRALGLLCT